MTDTEALIRAYYAAFDSGDRAAMCAILADDLAHDVNQGGRRRGKIAFRAFLAQMDACCSERIEDLVVMIAPSGTRAAAEFVVTGAYIRTDPPLPDARGQTYRLPAGAFFEVAEGRITRISTHYNLSDWIKQVRA